MAGKTLREFEVRQVANGFIVMPSGRRDCPVYYDSDDMHVFPTADALAAWLRETYSAPQPPVVPVGWKVIPA
jgi:hypothetical protein